MNRAKTLEALSQKPEVSVVIIGGGINGVGLLRELAVQKIDTVLVEKGDFCSGTSSASTRAIHGGLRYLENGEFRLVKESLQERNRLLLNAPHYVRPLPTTIPIFHWTTGLLSAFGKFLGFRVRPHEKGALLVKLGLSLYDYYAGRQNLLPKHKFSSRDAALKLRPELHQGIVCTATYYDACISYPERLCLELTLDAEQYCSCAYALNYVRAAGTDGNTVFLEDQITGQTIAVRPKVVVNASGPWIDFTNSFLRRETQYIGGTKGSHIVIDHPELLLATRDHMLYFENSDGRICLFYAVGGKIIAGSTDILVSDPDNAHCDEEEVDYILDSIRKVLPAIRVDQSHIVYRFCGVRPLPRSKAASPGEISRDHDCAVLPAGNGTLYPIYSLIGGKLTTFRAFGEQAADKILAYLGRSRLAQSRDLPIGGGHDYPRDPAEKSEWLADVSQSSGLTQERVEALLDRYGSRAMQVIRYLCQGSDGPLRNLPEYTRREISFMAAHEKVVHLDDVVLRRTMMALLGQLSSDLLVELADLLASPLGWSQEKVHQEVERTVRLIERDHKVRLAMKR